MTDQINPPKDGMMVCLLVDYSEDGESPLQDALTAWTIGYNTLADTGEDEWIMVGWDWCHDCYCQGSGKIIGWAPFAPTMARHKDTTPDAVARLVEAARAGLNYLENTEGEFGITLGSATGLRAALAAMEASHGE